MSKIFECDKCGKEWPQIRRPYGTIPNELLGEPPHVWICDCGCWLGKYGRRSDGRPKVDWYVNGKKRAGSLAHFLMSPANGEETAHLCHNVGCVRLSHLENVPHVVNIAQSKDVNPAWNHNKLSPSEQEQVFRWYEQGLTVKAIAKLAGISTRMAQYYQRASWGFPMR